MESARRLRPLQTQRTCLTGSAIETCISQFVLRFLRPLVAEEKWHNQNVGQCPTWWPPCRI